MNQVPMSQEPEIGHAELWKMYLVSQSDLAFSDKCLNEMGEYVKQIESEHSRMKKYLQFLYDGDGNIEFDELEVALRGKANL